MRSLALLLFAMMVGLIGPAWAEDAPDVQAIISQQLDAFAHEDAGAAFALAAPLIQEKFSDAATFMAMVKNAYPPVFKHRSVQFSQQAREGDNIRQGVVFVDPNNDVWNGVYTLARQSDGSWRIVGCVLRRSDDTSL